MAFLRFLDSPLRLVLVVAAVVLLLGAAIRRTRFKGATITPVIQRRRAGQHLGAAVQLARAHPALFVSIGLLLPVAGLVATLLQWLLTDTTELGDGLELAGSGSPWGSALVGLVGLVIVVPMTSIVYVAVAAAVRYLAGADPDSDADVDAGAEASASWRRSMTAVGHHPRAVLAELLVRAVTNALFFSIALAPVGVWLLGRWGIAAAAGLERSHPLQRSAELTRGGRLRAGALATLTTVLSLVIPALAATLLLLLTGWSFLFVNVVTGLVAAAVTPVMAAAVALLHGELASGEIPVTDPLRHGAMSD